MPESETESIPEEDPSPEDPPEEDPAPNKRKLELIAAPQQDVVVAVVKKKRGPTTKQQKERSDKGKERTKINKLQVAKGVRRVKVNTKWHVLDPEVSDIVFDYELTIVVEGDSCQDCHCSF